MRIGIRHPFALSLCLLLAVFFDGTGIIRACIIAILLHECGHALLLVLLLHQKPVFQVSFGGIALRWNTASAGTIKQTVILLAGPLANGAATAISYAFCNHQLQLWLYLFGGVNLLLGIFNLLPLGFLDGGRLLELFLQQFLPCDKVWKGLRAAQIVVLTIFSLFLLLFSSNTAARIALLLFFGYYCGKSFFVKN